MEGFNIVKKKVIYTTLIMCILVTVCILTVIFSYQNPLVISGFTEYDNGRNKVDIELSNKGNSDILIHEILVNDKTAEEVQLIVSYTLQLVAGGIDLNPWAKIVQINEEPIHPKFSPKELATD